MFCLFLFLELIFKIYLFEAKQKQKIYIVQSLKKNVTIWNKIRIKVFFVCLFVNLFKIICLIL